MKLLSLVGLCLVPLLVVSQSPPDVNQHLQDEGSVSSGEATEVMDTSSGQNKLRGSARALNTSLQEDAALRNESFPLLASHPQQQRRQLECCGGDGGSYGELKCPQGLFVKGFYGQWTSVGSGWFTNGASGRVLNIGIICSNGVTVVGRFGLPRDGGDQFVTNDNGFTGMYVETDSDVDFIEFWSHDNGRVGRFGRKLCGSNWGTGGECGESHHLDCPGGTRITGIRARSGDWVDKIMMPFCG